MRRKYASNHYKTNINLMMDEVDNTRICPPFISLAADIETHQIGQHFSNLLLSNVNEPI